MDIQQIKGVNRQWDAFVDSQPEGKIYHQSVFQKIISDTFGHEPVFLQASEHGELLGVLPLIHMRSKIFGNFLVSIPFFNYGGVCAVTEQARKKLLDTAVNLARKRKARHLELRHVRPLFAHLPHKAHKVCMILELPDSPEALWSQFKSKLRSQIRRPEKDGIYVKAGKAELLDDFYDVFSVNMRDLGTPVYPRKLFANVMNAFPQSSWILVAYKDTQPLAAGFVLGYKETLEIPWASSLRKYNRTSANMLMYWHALKLAIEQGYRKFDFGRSSPDSGTYKFKAQWGAKPVPLHWEYWLANGGPLPDMSPQNGKFQVAIRIWQRLPLPLTRLLGPAIVKNIP